MIIVVLIIKCITFIKLYSILALHGHAKKTILANYKRRIHEYKPTSNYLNPLKQLPLNIIMTGQTAISTVNQHSS